MRCFELTHGYFVKRLRIYIIYNKVKRFWVLISIKSDQKNA